MGHCGKAACAQSFRNRFLLLKNNRKQQPVDGHRLVADKMEGAPGRNREGLVHVLVPG
jgi:hypothetical protein